MQMQDTTQKAKRFRKRSSYIFRNKENKLNLEISWEEIFPIAALATKGPMWATLGVNRVFRDGVGIGQWTQSGAAAFTSRAGGIRLRQLAQAVIDLRTESCGIQ
jgi:hypothetical protein